MQAYIQAKRTENREPNYSLDVHFVTENEKSL